MHGVEKRTSLLSKMTQCTSMSGRCTQRSLAVVMLQHRKTRTSSSRLSRLKLDRRSNIISIRASAEVGRDILVSGIACSGNVRCSMFGKSTYLSQSMKKKKKTTPSPYINGHYNPCSRRNFNYDDINSVTNKRLSNRKLRAEVSQTKSPPRQEYNGVFLLLIINFIIFILDKQLGFSFISQHLYLSHSSPMPWQYLTATFCHASWAHLSQNGIMLYLFGRIVEEEEGTMSVIFAYLMTGAVAMLADILFIPSQMSSQAGGGFLPFLWRGAQQAKVAVVSVGASGAVFGML